MSRRASYPRRGRPAPAPIRIRNTRTGRTTIANGGADAALIAKVELDRRSGIALAEMDAEAAREAADILLDERRDGIE